MWPPAPNPPRAGLTTLLLTTLLAAGVAKECAVSECTAAFHEGTNAGVQKGPTLAYCQLLQAYKACLEETRSSCRADIHYLSASGMASHVSAGNNCSSILSGELAPSPSAGGDALAPAAAAAATDADDLCRYRAAAVAAPAHCGLFGDPHLKTFAGAYMTCRVLGAWPLLNTPDIAIQVTNEPVGPDNYATATTKVTVLIKGHSRCGSRSTYEASSESLPKAFVDGTTWSGVAKDKPSIQVREAVPGEHVLITVSYINATVAVRKIGRYLTVLVTLPESLLEELERDGDEVQLCLQGCHEQERLDRPGAAPLSMAAMSKSKAKELCKGYNVTDYYLDSCIFDLMATGDTSFCKAAQTAQKDLWEHDPIGAQRLLLNCSDPPCMWEPSSSSLTRYPSLLIILLALLLQG